MTRSTDGGETWSTPTGAFDRSSVGLKTTAFTKRADGNLEVVLLTNVQISANNGTTWTSVPYQTYTVPSNGRSPRVLFDDRVLRLSEVTENDAYEWGPDQDIAASFSFDEGQTFTAPEIIQSSFFDDSGSGDAPETTLGILPNGDILCAWVTRETDGGFAQHDGDIVAMRTTPEGEPVWEGPTFVNTDFEDDSRQDTGYPMIRRGPGGSVRIFWVRLFHDGGEFIYDLTAADSDDNGETWSDPEIIVEIENFSRIDSEWLGEDYWLHVGTLPSLITVENNEGETNQIDPVHLEEASIILHSPAVAADGNGSAAVAICRINPDTDIRLIQIMHTSDYGVSWNSSTLVTPEAFQSRTPELAAAKATGGPWVIVATYVSSAFAPEPGLIASYIARSDTPGFESASLSVLPGGEHPFAGGDGYSVRRTALVAAPDALYFMAHYQRLSFPIGKGAEVPPVVQILVSTNGGGAWRNAFGAGSDFDSGGAVAAAGGILYNADSDSNYPIPRPPQYRAWQVSFDFAEDIDGSGAIDAVDIQLLVNALLGESEGDYDVNDDGIFDAADLQALINAALS